MLAYILAVLVGTGSVGLYVAAFFFPEVHRQQDFIWSGIGFFYALCLWIYAHQITGGILVGQIASVALLGLFAWQILKLRRQLVPVSQQTPLPDTTRLQTRLGLNRSIAPKAAKLPSKTPAIVQPETPVTPTTPTNSAARRSAGKDAAPTTKNKPLSPVTIPPASQPTRPLESNVPASVQQPSQLDSNPKSDPAIPNSEEAWIKLELKPATPATKPLGTAVKPPMSTNSQPETPPPPATIPASAPANIATESIETSAKLDPERQES
jgi:hypothetical protein